MEEFLGLPLLGIIVVLIVVKGMALWKAARLKHQKWFWCLLIFNTVGILPAYYLYKYKDKKV